MTKTKPPKFSDRYIIEIDTRDSDQCITSLTEQQAKSITPEPGVAILNFSKQEAIDFAEDILYVLNVNYELW